MHFHKNFCYRQPCKFHHCSADEKRSLLDVANPIPEDGTLSAMPSEPERATKGSVNEAVEFMVRSRRLHMFLSITTPLLPVPADRACQ